MSQHTPGPWELGKEDPEYVRTAEGAPVALALSAPGFSKETIHANARLIVLGPAMLKELKAFAVTLIEHLGDEGPVDSGIWAEHAEIVSALLAKVEGK